MTERKGRWYGTNSGLRYWPLDPRPEEITLEDIAHHLSMICRFGGAVDHHYSVAQHSVLCSLAVDDELALEGLLHDAPEAYLGDMVRPTKHGSDLGAMFRLVEDLNRRALAEKFDLEIDVPRLVKHADNRLLLTEARDLFKNSHWEDWELAQRLEPYEFEIVPWSQRVAKERFLYRYNYITITRAF